MSVRTQLNEALRAGGQLFLKKSDGGDITGAEIVGADGAVIHVSAELFKEYHDRRFIKEDAKNWVYVANPMHLPKPVAQ